MKHRALFMFAAITAFLSAAPAGAVVGVIGAPGTGKSQALKAADGEAWSRRVVFEPYAERDLMLFNAGRSPAHPWSGTWITAPELVRHRGEVLDFDPVSVVVTPTSLEPEQLGKECAQSIQACWRTGGITWIGEEAGLYSRWCVTMLMQIASGGRHADMRAVLVSQSLGRLAIDVRRHFSHLVIFAQGEPGDLDDIKKRCGREIAARVQALRPGDPPVLWRLGDAVRRT